MNGPISPEENDQRLDEVLAEYLTACERGEAPARDAFLARYPEFAGDLREFWDRRDRMERWMAPVRDVVQHLLTLRCPYCHHSIELQDDSAVGHIACPTCGNAFSLVSSSELAAGKEIGRFRLIEQVGMGQFGIVWKAHDQTLDRLVAIKTPRRRQLEAAEVEAFLRDARTAARLIHPHIARVYEVGKHEDTVYIVSDLIEGESLRKQIDAGRLSVRESVALCSKIADALHFAHQAGVIHRDMKPANVMVDRAGDPHVVDFGLARHEAHEVTMTVEGQILGTPAYMPPEQARGENHRVSPASDIYSLGVTLYEMLTGELPFRGTNPMVLWQIVQMPPPSPRRFNSAIPRDLETICGKCLEKEPTRRYTDARALADDCRRFLQGEPVQARPTSAVVKSIRWCARNRLVTGFAVVTLASLLLTAIVAFSGWMRVRQSLTVAEDRAQTIEENLYFSEMTRAGQSALSPNGLAEVRRLLAKWIPSSRQGVDRRGWEWHYLASLSHQDLATWQHAGGVAKLVWAPGGEWLASAGYDGNIRLWQADQQPQSLDRAHARPLLDLAWSPDGQWIVASDDTADVRVWSRDGTHTAPRVLHHAAPVRTAAWSHDGKWIATVSIQHVEPNTTSPNPTASAQGTLWDTTSWTMARQFPLAIDGARRIRWSPSGETLAVAPERGPIQIVSLATGQVLHRVGRVVAMPLDLDWDSSGTWLAISHRHDSNLLLWHAEQAESQVVTAGGAVASLQWHPQRLELAFADGDKDVRLYDITTKTTRKILRGHAARVTAVTWHPQGTHLASGDIDGDLKVWSAEPTSEFSSGSAFVHWNRHDSHYLSRINGDVIRADFREPDAFRVIQNYSQMVCGVASSPDGQRAAAISYDGDVRVFHAQTGELLAQHATQLHYRGTRLPRLLDFSADGRWLAIPSGDSNVHVIDAQTGQFVRALEGGPGHLSCLAWHPREPWVLVGERNPSAVRLWQATTGQQLATIDALATTVSVAWSPGGQEAAFAESENGVLIWDLPTRAMRRLVGHTTYVHSVAWHPNATRLASADESGSVRVWDPRSGNLALVLAFPGGVPDLAWSPDGNQLLAVGYGGRRAVRYWDSAVPAKRSRIW